MNDLNYVIGRLHGMNELVKILKDLADKKGAQNTEIITVMVDHIAEQLDSIIADFDSIKVQPEHKDLLMDLKEKHFAKKQEEEEEAEEKEEEEELPREKLEKHERTVDDLLRDLESMKN